MPFRGQSWVKTRLTRLFCINWTLLIIFDLYWSTFVRKSSYAIDIQYTSYTCYDYIHINSRTCFTQYIYRYQPSIFKKNKKSCHIYLYRSILKGALNHRDSGKDVTDIQPLERCQVWKIWTSLSGPCMVPYRGAMRNTPATHWVIGWFSRTNGPKKGKVSGLQKDSKRW